MPYDVLDVARYVINYSNEKGYGCSNLKLQKLLYLTQAYFLISTNGPLFLNEIQAWDFGPVIPDAYHEFKRFGAGDIPFVTRYFEMPDGTLSTLCECQYDPELIDKKTKRLINDVVDNFKDYTSTALVTLTHNQAPWKDNFVPNEQKVIPLDQIRAYFSTD